MQTTSKRRSVLLYNPVFIEYGNTTTEFCSLRIYNKICCAETRDNDTITRKVRADGNKLCPGKEWRLYTQ